MKESGKKKAIEKLIFYFVFLFGLIWIFLVPPLQKADESTHYFRAASLTKGELVCQMGVEKDAFEIEKKYFNFAEKVKLNQIAFNYSEKTSLREIYSIKSGYFEEESDVLLKNFCSLPFFPYLVFVLPLLVGNFFNSLLIGFFLSRLSAFLLFFFCVFWSYRKIRYSKFRWVIIIFALTPMVLHQASSIGYDYLILSITPLIFSMNIDFLNKKKIRKKGIVLYALLILLFLISKPGYYFVSLAYFLIPPEKITKDRKKYIITTVTIFSLCIIFSVLSVKAYTSVVGMVVTPSLSEVLGFLDLKKILLIVKNTFVNNFDTYIRTFIGRFGWLDYGLTDYFYYMYSFFSAALIIYLSKDQIYEKYKKRIIIVTSVMIIFSIALLFGGFYYSYFYESKMAVIGIQGRYLLVFFPYIILLLGIITNLFLKHRKFRLFLLIFVLFIILLEMSYSIYLRYYKGFSTRRDSSSHSLISFTPLENKTINNFIKE